MFYIGRYKLLCAGYVILNKININREMLPDLQPMKKRKQKLIADQDEIGDYRKEQRYL